MNFLRLFLAALAAFVAYMLVGGLLFKLIPALKTEFLRFPAVYRDQAGQMSHMAAGMAAMFLSIVVLGVLYAQAYPGGAGVMEGARFGFLIGLFAIGAFVFHNYVNLNIGLKLTLQQGAVYLLEWVIVGLVLGAIYRPILKR